MRPPKRVGVYAKGIIIYGMVHRREPRQRRIYKLAIETFGAKEKAERWLRRPLRQFHGRTPMEMLETDSGSRQVEVLLGRIGHGLAA